MKVLFLVNKHKAKWVKCFKHHCLKKNSKQNTSFDYKLFSKEDRKKTFALSLKMTYDKIIVIDEYDSYGFIYFSKQKDFFCSNAYNSKLAQLSILHNNANVLVIGYKTICCLKIIQIIKIFLSTTFEGGRHSKRLEILHNSFIESNSKTNVNFANHNDSIIIASDHAGVELKNKIIFYLNEKHFKVVDAGTYSKDSCDYPVFGIKLGQIMLNQGQKGIVICGSGMGICNTVNKFDYLRCINAYKKSQLLNSFQYDVNVLGFGGRFISFMKAKKMVDLFLKNKTKVKNNSLANCGLQLKSG